MHRLRNSTVVVAACTMIALAGCGSTAAGAARPADPNGGSLVVGSTDVAENILVAEIYAAALQAQGFDIERRLDLGSREEVIPSLLNGKTDLVPEYSGDLLGHLDPDTDDTEDPGEAVATDSAAIYRDLVQVIPNGLLVLDPSRAQDQDALVVTEQTADEYDLFSVADLAGHAQDLTLGGSRAFRTSATGPKGLRRLYGLTFADYLTLDSGGPKTVAALREGRIDVANLLTTDPNIAVEGWVVLPDPKGLFPAQNVLPLIRAAKATDPVKNILYAVDTALTTDKLTSMMVQVSIRQRSPADVAAQFLTENGLD